MLERLKHGPTSPGAMALLRTTTCGLAPHAWNEENGWISRGGARQPSAKRQSTYGPEVWAI